MRSGEPRKRPKRKDYIVRMGAGDEIRIKSQKSRRRVRVSADEGVVVEHLRKAGVDN